MTKLTIESTQTAGISTDQINAIIDLIEAETGKNGLGTYVTLIASVASGVAAIYAGVKGADTEAVAAGFGAVVSALTAAGGKYAQATAKIKALARIVQPTVDRLAE